MKRMPWSRLCHRFFAPEAPAVDTPADTASTLTAAAPSDDLGPGHAQTVDDVVAARAAAGWPHPADAVAASDGAGIGFPFVAEGRHVQSQRAALDVLRAPQSYSSKTYEALLGSFIPRALIASDPPDHVQRRRPLLAAFRPASIDRERDWIQALAHESALVARGLPAPDLGQHVAEPYAVRVTCGFIGIPRERFDQVLALARSFGTAGIISGEAIERSDEVRDLCLDALAARRQSPSDDLMGRLVCSDPPLDDEEIIDLVRLLIPAGVHTTTKGIVTMFRHILTDPERLSLLRQDLSRVGDFIEESLRVDPPTRMVHRVTTSDVVLQDVSLPTATTVGVSIYAANRDPEVYADPAAFDGFRSRPTSLTFGAGSHACLGVHLALTQLEALAAAFVETFDTIAFADDLDPSALDFTVGDPVPYLPLSLA